MTAIISCTARVVDENEKDSSQKIENNEKEWEVGTPQWKQMQIERFYELRKANSRSRLMTLSGGHPPDDPPPGGTEVLYGVFEGDANSHSHERWVEEINGPPRPNLVQETIIHEEISFPVFNDFEIQSQPDSDIESEFGSACSTVCGYETGLEEPFEVDDCCICLEELSAHPFTTVCGHRFHTVCYRRFVRRGGIRCPICRSDM